MTKNKGKSSLKSQFSNLNNLGPFFRMIWDTHKGLSLLTLILRLLKSILPLLILYVGKEIIDTIILLIDQPDADKHYLWGMLALELFLALSSDLLNRMIGLVDSLLGDLFSNETSVQLIRHAATLDLYQFEDAGFYDKLERARRTTNMRTALMAQVLTQLQDVVTLLSLAAGLIIFNPWLILILALAVLPSFWGETHFNRRTYSLTRQWTPERRELDYFRYIGASDETAKEIKIFNLQEFISTRFKDLSDRYYEENKKIAVKRAWIGSLLSALGTLSYYGAYVFIILQTVGGLITLGTLTFLSGSFSRMRSLLQTIVTRFSKIADGTLYLNDLFDFLALESSIKDGEEALDFPDKIEVGFEFQNVSFKYFNSDKYVIKDLSFTLKAGEKLALVGENGAGKTTLVKLLARLYDPTEGRILLDGVDIRKYKLSEYREAIGVIFQDFQKFQLKAFENIAVGDIKQVANRSLIEEASEKSLADEVVQGLDKGLDQHLGKRFAEGTELSGGQWQKIALARAYMKDFDLLILDEPTAALDARAEHEVFERFTDLIVGKTAVLISHRFSTVRMADRILFLENGQKLELGTHEELMKQDGKYAELFNLQASGYV